MGVKLERNAFEATLERRPQPAPRAAPFPSVAAPLPSGGFLVNSQPRNDCFCVFGDHKGVRVSHCPNQARPATARKLSGAAWKTERCARCLAGYSARLNVGAPAAAEPHVALGSFQTQVV